MSVITDAEKNFYTNEGYIIIRNLLPVSEAEAILERTDGMLAGQYPTEGFVAGPASNEGPDDPGRLIKQIMSKQWPPADRVLAQYGANNTLREAAFQLMETPDAIPFQQQILVKEPGSKNATPWHQDDYYWNFGPLGINAITAWMPLSPTTAATGTMWLLPRSHNEGITNHVPAGGNSKFRVIDRSFDETKLIPLELNPGDVSFHHKNLIHGAFANQGQKRRVAIAQHYKEKNA